MTGNRIEILNQYLRAVRADFPETQKSTVGLLLKVSTDLRNVCSGIVEDPSISFRGFTYCPATRALAKPDGEGVVLGKTVGLILNTLMLVAPEIVPNRNFLKLVDVMKGYNDDFGYTLGELKSQISHLRRALGDQLLDPAKGRQSFHRYIQSVRTGYRFNPPEIPDDTFQV